MQDLLKFKVFKSSLQCATIFMGCEMKTKIINNKVMNNF